MSKFAVTYERYFPHDEGEDICEADERGFAWENATLRQAIDAAGGIGAYYEADSWPVRKSCPPRWFTNDRWSDGTREEIEQGIRESRSLHLPADITPSSAIRIARLLGVKVQ